MRIYFIGIGFFLLHLLSNVANDIVQKYTGCNLSAFEVLFFRFLFGTLMLVPLIIYYGKETLRTNNIYIHLLRGLLLFIGLLFWIYGLMVVKVTTVTVMGLAIPVVTLVLARIFLNERIIWQRWLVTIVAFLGITIVLNPGAEFKVEMLALLGAVVCFAMLDVVNKKIIVEESMLGMLFYSSLATTVLSAVPFLVFNWQTPSQPLLAALFGWQDPTAYLPVLFLLGIGANLVLYFILKAFSYADATAIAPYRFLELIIAAIAAYYVFAEQPEKSTLYGACIIIPATLFIIYSEKRQLAKSS
jgi:S-adenosylmethionine uptake transporter